MTSKNKYIAFCNSTKKIPLFMQPYWLDAAAGSKHWDAVMSYSSEGEILGAWAYCQKRILGMNAIVMPYLTPFTGIYLNQDDQLPLQKQAHQRQEILEDLISQLPDVSYFEQKLNFSLQDWAPFYWEGYKEKTHYTFRFEHPDIDEVYGNFSGSFKRNLRVAERTFNIGTSTSAIGLYQLVESVFANRKLTVPFSEKFLNNLIDIVSERRQCTVYRATHSQEVKAAIVTVWDEDTTYYLLNGRDFSQKGDSTSLLLWQAIQDAAKRGHHFDFEGSMMKGVHRFFQSFGSTMTPYHYIYRYTGLARLKNLI